MACLCSDPSSYWVFLFNFFFLLINYFFNPFSSPVVSGLPGSRPTEAAARCGGSEERVQGAAPPAAAGAERLRAGAPTPRIAAPAPDRPQLQSTLGTGSVSPTRKDCVRRPVVWGACRILGCDGEGGRQGSGGFSSVRKAPEGDALYEVGGKVPAWQRWQRWQ